MSRLLARPLFLFVVLLLTAVPPVLAGDDAMDSLVSAEWLVRQLDDPDLVVLDCSVHMVMDESGGMRSLSGRAGYEDGHIPGAGFADLLGDLRDADSSLNFALPTPERFCEVMGALGVGDDTRVVLYDNSNTVWAARVWWMLNWVGFDRAALLDGGLRAWTGAGHELSTAPPDPPARRLTPRVRPALIADRDEVFAAITDDAVALIDVMPAAHFRGEMVMYARPGHIPSAVNQPVMALFDAQGRFRPAEELAEFCAGDRTARTITYCGGGIAASASAFAMHRLGFTDVAVYMGSLQEWTADPDNPLEVAGN